MNTKQEIHLFRQAMEQFERQYDPSCGLLFDPVCAHLSVHDDPSLQESGVHEIRSSIYYALALLMEGGRDELAAHVIGRVLDYQFPEEGTIYDGTFKRYPEEPDPPAQSSVWDHYDPNWREFIGTVLCMILHHFAARLPSALAARVQQAIRLAARHSIDRRVKDWIPMQNNVEFMHLFLCAWTGERLGEPDNLAHAKRIFAALMDDFARTGTLAEYNSPTYYAVDLIALSCICSHVADEQLRAWAETLRARLWEEIAAHFSPSLGNVCGPYTRYYEMELTAHSALGHILYLCLGDPLEHLSGENCETFDNPLLLLSDMKMPDEVRACFLEEQPPRLLKQEFYELCEYLPRGRRRNLCTATSCIRPYFMMCGCDGSGNTAGMLQPAAMMWQYRGAHYWMRVIRRRPGGHWIEHFYGVEYHGRVDEDSLRLDAVLSGGQPIEVCLEICGPGVAQGIFTTEQFVLPGLSCRVDATADAPYCRRLSDDRVELCVLYEGARNEEIALKLYEIVHTAE